MLVNRFTRIVKKGHFDEAVEFIKSEIERFPTSHATRVYSGYAAPTDTLVMEFEFENLEELGKHWENWFADPESAKYREKINELTETGGDNEIWNLI
jgi:hypothetical protein